MAKKKAKPRPISTSLTRKPVKKVVPPSSDLEPFNDVSPLVEMQISKANQAIENLREEVVSLRNRPTPEIPKLKAPQVLIPPRPRIAKVVIKYDTLGFPSELIPQYSEGR